MVIDKTIFQTNAPSHSDVIWAKPEGDKITLHMYNRGKWMPVSGAIDQNVKKTYPVDPNATLLTKTTRYSDIVTDDLFNAVKSELNIDHDAPYSDEELQAMSKALLSKINDNKYGTKDHGMATATAFDVGIGNLVFTCDDGTLFIMPKRHSINYEFQRKEPFDVTADGVQSAAIIAQAKVLGINIDKYLPNMSFISADINNAWGSYNSEDEYIAAMGKVNNELKSMQYITEKHGSAELKVINGYITEGASFLFKCEDGTIIQTLGDNFVKEYLPAPDYTRFQLINDLYGANDWEYDQNAPYVIIDTKDTEGKITDEVLRDYVIEGIPDLTTLHNYTDTIYMPAEAILFKVDSRINWCSSFFKLYYVNSNSIGIPDYIQAIVNRADQGIDLPSGPEVFNSAPTLNATSDSGSTGTIVSVWKTTVELSDGTLAYIFMTISTALNRSTPFGIATISMSPLYFSDNGDFIPNYGPQADDEEE